MEQIRVVKEMRENDRKNGRTNQFCRPRFMVWENVAGAFTSNGGKDFQAVLTEIVKIAEPNAPDVPLPEKGKWPHAGELHDDMGRWSVAWRLVDAQYYGTPQRRKRVALVADFSGGGASDVLFEQCFGDESEPEIQSESESLSGNIEQSGTQRKDSAEAVGNSLEKTSEGGSISFQERAGKPGGGKGILIQNEHTGALSTLNNQSVFGISSFESNAMKSSNPNSGIYEADTARTLDNNGGSPDCHQGGMAVVYDASRRHDYQPFGDVSETVQAQHGTGGNNQPLVVKGVDVHNGKVTGDVTAPITCNSNATSTQPIVLEGRSSFNQGKNAQFGFCVDEEKIGAQVAKGPGAVCSVDCRNGTEDEVNGSLQASADHNNNSNNVCQTNASVRRLTPLECNRLQGFPDGWLDIGDWIDSKGKLHKDADSPKYKALGNSIAIPFWFWLMRRISAQYTRRATLGSLFDGIGGFPLCWEMCNGKGTARWASEIEEFPIAVTKKRFPENSQGGGTEMIDPIISFTMGSYMEVNTEMVASTIMARDYKDPQSIYRSNT